jgi:hypothetical protein
VAVPGSRQQHPTTTFVGAERVGVARCGWVDPVGIGGLVLRRQWARCVPQVGMSGVGEKNITFLAEALPKL